jgi:hypothetical protein
VKIKLLVLGAALAAGLTACGAAGASTTSGTSAGSSSNDLKVAVVFTMFNGLPQGSSCNVGAYNVTLTDQNNTTLGQQTIQSAFQGQAPDNVATSQAYNSSGDLACVSTLDFGNIGTKTQYGVAVTNIGLVGEGAPTSNTVFFSQADRESNGNMLTLTYSGE